MNRDYGKWSLSHLQDELRHRKVKSSGRKKELVERLIALDSLSVSGSSSQSSRESPTSQSSSEPPWPPAINFKSLTPSMKNELPDLTTECIEQYVRLHQANDKSGEIASLSQGSLLAKDKVHGISIAQDGCVDNCYVSGLVEAHYKKVYYSVKLKISRHGEITYSSCECPAGSGPNSTCKHIIAGMNVRLLICPSILANVGFSFLQYVTFWLDAKALEMLMCAVLYRKSTNIQQAKETQKISY